MTATSLDLSQIKTDALSSAATFRTLVGLGSSDAVTFKEATLTSGTVTSSTPVINATQTWNDGATAFDGIKLNISNTASSSNSVAIGYYLNSSPKFRVMLDGKIKINVGGNDQWLNNLSGLNNYGMGVNTGGEQYFIFNGQINSVVGNNIRTNGFIGFYTGSSATPTSDVTIYRDAADTLAQRNGTNAQTFRLYNTYTSSTSFERLNVRWATNELIIDAEAGSGGGTLRGIKLGSATTSLLGFYGVTPVDQPLTVSDPTGGGTVDTEARTAIGEIIDRLQELGLIA